MYLYLVYMLNILSADVQRFMWIYPSPVILVYTPHNHDSFIIETFHK